MFLVSKADTYQGMVRRMVLRMVPKMAPKTVPKMALKTVWMMMGLSNDSGSGPKEDSNISFGCAYCSDSYLGTIRVQLTLVTMAIEIPRTRKLTSFLTIFALTGRKHVS